MDNRIKIGGFVMNDCEYVDVFSDKYTRMWKTIAIVRLSVKIFVVVIFTISLVLVVKGLQPYIEGTEVWEEMPFTLSQLNALLCVFVWIWMFKQTIKVL